MRSVLWLLLGVVIGGFAGWYLHAHNQEVRASTKFSFRDKLADPQAPYLSARGTWRGSHLSNQTNTVRIVCFSSEMTCELTQADVDWSPGGTPYLSLFDILFRITKLDGKSVVAEADLDHPCFRRTLTLDRMADQVTMARIKIGGKDCADMENELRLVLGEPR